MASKASVPPAATRPVAGILLVAAVEIAGASALRQFLLAEDWRWVLLLLAGFAAVLVALERRRGR